MSGWSPLGKYTRTKPELVFTTVNSVCAVISALSVRIWLGEVWKKNEPIGK